MTEVAGDAGFLISRRPMDPLQAQEWALSAASVVNKIVTLSPADRKMVVEAGINNARKFDTQLSLDQIEKIYVRILHGHKAGNNP